MAAKNRRYPHAAHLDPPRRSEQQQAKHKKTDCSVNATYENKTYCFGNEAAKEEFMKDPAANLAKAQQHYQEQKKG